MREDSGSPTLPLSFRGLIGLAVLLASLLMLVSWIDNQDETFYLTPFSETEISIGKLELVKPWKTSPYILLDTTSGAVKLSCYGPFKRNYWCGDIEKTGVDPGAIYLIRSSRPTRSGVLYVYEISSKNGVIVDFEKQSTRFLDANMAGPSYIQIFASILLFAMAMYLIFKR